MLKRFTAIYDLKELRYDLMKKLEGGGGRQNVKIWPSRSKNYEQQDAMHAENFIVKVQKMTHRIR